MVYAKEGGSQKQSARPRSRTRKKSSSAQLQGSARRARSLRSLNSGYCGSACESQLWSRSRQLSNLTFRWPCSASLAIPHLPLSRRPPSRHEIRQPALASTLTSRGVVSDISACFQTHFREAKAIQMRLTRVTVVSGQLHRFVSIGQELPTLKRNSLDWRILRHGKWVEFVRTWCRSCRCGQAGIETRVQRIVI